MHINSRNLMIVIRCVIVNSLGKTGEIVCAGMTREQMARYLGMNRSALSRLLGTMQREGRLELRRGSLRLLNDIET